MSTVAFTPSRSLVSADLLKLGRRRGLVVVTGLLTLGTMAITYTIIELLHLSNPAHHGPAGGVANLGHGAWIASVLGAVAAAIVGSMAGTGDLESGVYRDLVVTGRSRFALYRSRLRGGLIFLVPFVAGGYALAGIVSVVFAGSYPAPSVSLLMTTGLWALLQVAFYYLLAFGIACLIGSRAYTIGILLAFRLALTPILASISLLGIGRELLPGVALQGLTPAALGGSAQQGPTIPMSTLAIAVVLIVWAAAALVAGAWRDTRQDA